MPSDIDQPHYQDGKLQSLIPMQHHVCMTCYALPTPATYAKGKQ